jgi:predicted nucleic acid-binding Zn ribbon protein
MQRMPTYDYHCEANGRTVEVSHRMAERLITWGEVCERAGLPLGNTPARTPVNRLVSGAAVLSGKSGSAAAAMESCAAGPACCGGGCSAAH